jgi:hypothetical protein
MKKNVIWQNINLNVDDWRDGYAEHCEINGLEYDENEIADFMYFTNDLYLDDERANLQTKLDGDIIIIADLGLWFGRKPAYKVLKSRNIADILYIDDDFMEFYGDGKNIRARGIHHDGENRYLYRYFKPDLSENQKQKFLDLILEGRLTPAQISRYTVSLFPAVASVYGW